MSMDSTQKSILGSSRFCLQRRSLRPGYRRGVLRASIQWWLSEPSEMTDLKFAFRQLRKSPGFTLVAVLTLALGIGANTAIFSVVAGVLLRPLPFPHAERLVRIYEALDENGARSASLNLSDRTLARFREFGHEIFEDVAGGVGGASVIGANGSSPVETVPAAQITSNFFDVLGLSPAQGR